MTDEAKQKERLTHLGKPKSVETINKLRVANLGKEFTKERCKNISIGVTRHHSNSEYREKRSQNAKELWQDPEYANKHIGKKRTEEFCIRQSERIQALWKNPEFVLGMMKSFRNLPNKLEKSTQNIISELGLLYRYTGDGQFSIGSKIPDFVNVNGKKQIIEILGCYWHGCKQCHPKVEVYDDYENRIKLFKDFGYDTLVIWEHEFEDLELVRQKILEFDREANYVH
jgi:G:T-mismatch repair DNA endonuclease (very short patch repair protein)